jgi:hypothetical protein
LPILGSVVFEPCGVAVAGRGPDGKAEVVGAFGLWPRKGIDELVDLPKGGIGRKSWSFGTIFSGGIDPFDDPTGGFWHPFEMVEEDTNDPVDGIFANCVDPFGSILGGRGPFGMASDVVGGNGVVGPLESILGASI